MGGGRLGCVREATGCIGTDATQPESALNGILLISIWLPLILLIGILVAMYFYDLDDKYASI